jgi:GNAT superfamily N-acetyltransferase
MYQSIQTTEDKPIISMFANDLLLNSDWDLTRVLRSNLEHAKENITYMSVVIESRPLDEKSRCIGVATARRCQSSNVSPDMYFEVSVRPSHLRRGIGTVMLKELIDQFYTEEYRKGIAAPWDEAGFQFYSQFDIFNKEEMRGMVDYYQKEKANDHSST